MNDLNSLKAMLEEIPEGGQILPANLTSEEKENRRSRVLELCVHASDISFLSRTLEASKTQAYGLFEEFFVQGDIEAEKGLPISFLCDRATTNVAKN